MAVLPPGLSKNKKLRVDPNLQKLSLRFQKAQQAYASESAKSLQDYQSKLDEYNANFADYESRAKAFQDRADAYNKALDAWNTRGDRFGVEVAIDRSGLVSPRNWKPYTSQSGAINLRNQLTQFGVDPKSFSTGRAFDYSFNFDKNTILDFEQTGSKGNFSYGYLYRRGGPDPGVFSEQFTEAAPDAPAAVDLSAPQAKLAQEEQYYKREVGERQLGRIRARRRVAERPLLGSESA